VATVSSVVSLAQRDLARTSASARLDAELLVAHVLGVTRSQLLAAFPEQVTSGQIMDVDALVDRRMTGEPIAYIVGHREFYGRRFAVSPAVLTPRPETELLVEWALSWLASAPNATVVDVGTGSGAIAISVALETPATVRVLASDISPEALEVARRNAASLGAEAVEFLLGDLLEPIDRPVDLVLANLPYLRADQVDGNRDLVAEPRLALDGGEDGLDLIARLIDQLPSRLASGGAVALEIDPSQVNRAVQLLGGLMSTARITAHQDLAGLDRVVSAVRPH
jgi:release factor glutamine methyltransferase